jgi:SOS-response transcriptional repressor LexA
MGHLSDLLEKQQKKLDVNYTKIANQVGISSVYISQVLRGQRIPKDAILVKIAEALALDPSTVLHLAHYEKAPEAARRFLEPSENPQEEGEKFDNVEPHSLGSGRRVPVVGWVQAGKFAPAGAGDLTALNPDDYIYSDTLGRNLFALRVENDSMEPLFRAGDIIIVNPNIKPKNGDYVVARLKNEGEVTFKKLHISNGQIALRPLNHEYNDIILKEDQDFEIIGKVVERKTIF